MKNVKKLISNLLSTEYNVMPLSTRKNDSSEIMVSIHCFVFNQEKFIQRCIDSFLMQLVNFNVEILIHDDCSNDASKSIIEKYAKKYPNIIKPIFEKENVYSNTGNFLEIAKILNNQSRGKYIAICEGDDFWIDPHKLFLQVAVLEECPDCHFCVHRVKVESGNKDYKAFDQIPSFKMKTQMLTDVEFISLIHEKYNFQTSSYFFKKEDYDLLFKERPLYSLLMPSDDEVLLRHFGSLGYTCFIDRPMSKYLQFVDGSWSKDHIESDSNKKHEMLKRFIDAINAFDDYTSHKYNKSCKKMLLRIDVTQKIKLKQYDEIFTNKETKKALKYMDFRTYLSLKIRRIFGRKNG